MAKIFYCAELFRPVPQITKQVRARNVVEKDSEGFPAGYLYLELKQPHFI